jgi:hypothetical protein
MKKLIATAALLLIAPALASAQKADKQSQGEGYFFFGPIATDRSYRRGGLNTGFGGDLFLYKGLGLGAEVGYANNQWSFSKYGAVGTGSIDMSYHLLSKMNHRKAEPFAVMGYSTFFGNRGAASGLNFGGGVNYWFAKHAAFRLEFRDYAHIGPDQFGGINNFAAFRFGVTFR